MANDKTGNSGANGHVIKLPDVGEGIAEAELVEWHVAVGDVIREDQLIAAVMTDKATVEIPSPVEGTVLWLGAEVGETVAVGSPIVRIAVAGGDAAATDDAAELQQPAEDHEPANAARAQPAPAPVPPSEPAPKAVAATVNGNGKAKAPAPSISGAPRPEGERPLASPAVRLRAREAGIDLRQVRGTGPAGRIAHEDLDAFLSRGQQPAAATGLQRRDGVETVKVVGLRRRIAEKMALAKSRIPHITYVEEIDVTALEELRARLNAEKKDGRPKLTLLPFLMRAMVKAIGEQPALNATFDDETGIIHRHAAVHIGIKR